MQVFAVFFQRDLFPNWVFWVLPRCPYPVTTASIAAVTNPTTTNTTTTVTAAITTVYVIIEQCAVGTEEGVTESWTVL